MADEPTALLDPYDIYTVVGSSLFQPLADLIDKLLAKEERAPSPSGASCAENGYAVSIIVLLNVVLESYFARVKVRRLSEVRSGNLPEQLGVFFPDLPNADAVKDVYMVGKIATHNHIWHLQLTEPESGAVTLSNPRELGFATKKDYESIVDIATRKTKLLKLNARPDALDRHDVRAVLEVVWATLTFMAAKNYDHTPVHFHTIRFRGNSVGFGELQSLFPPARPALAS